MQSTTPGDGSIRSGLSSLVRSAEGVYGLILVAGMIVVSRNLTGTSAQALLSVVVTLVVFFAAHVYAATVSWMAEGEDRSVPDALRRGIHESAGLLVVGAIPVAVLALGVVGILRNSDAVWLALVTDLVLLGLLGWFIASTRTTHLWARLGTIALTVTFGAVLIAFKALIHH